VDVAVGPFGTVTGTVLDGGGQPAGGAAVYVGTSYGSFYGTADVAGVYTVPFVPTGDVYVTADVSGTGVTGSVMGTLASDGDTLTLDVSLIAAGTVSGVVRDETGLPVPGAAVTVYSTGSSVGPRYVTADAAGAYAVTNVAAGDITISATTADGELVSAVLTTTLTVHGQTVTADLALEATSLTVTVLTAAGAPASSARVLVRPISPVVFDTEIVANAAGVAVFPRLRVGTRTLRAIHAGRLRDASVDLVNGVPASLTITLP
jgi:hypothetical protein